MALQVFTPAQITDLIRHCGYPPIGNAQTGFQSIHFFQQQGDFLYKINNLNTNEGTIVLQYLAQLNTMEQAIVGTADNLDTDQAAVWFHNKNELRDRYSLYNSWRRRLCEIIGVYPGVFFNSTNSSVCVA
jgi:hypothetical protein